VTFTLAIGTTKPNNWKANKTEALRCSTLFCLFSLLVESLYNAHAVHGEQVVYMPKPPFARPSKMPHQTLFKEFLSRTHISIKTRF
jgi:hypothetical protein